jgi:hypothetical protein
LYQTTTGRREDYLVHGAIEPSVSTTLQGREPTKITDKKNGQRIPLNDKNKVNFVMVALPHGGKVYM